MTTSRLQAAYDRIAPRFAKRNAAMSPSLLAAAQDFLARVGPNASVLDIGCGAGRDLVWFERHGLHIAGVDLSAGMLRQSHAVAAAPLLQMDMRHLAFRSESFAGAWCIASLLHLSKLEVPNVLREIRRVLISGGVLFLSVQEGAGEGWERGAFYGAIRRFVARYSLSEVHSLLSGAGFKVVHAEVNRSETRQWLMFLATAGS